ncbi:MAG: electron transport complex subunit E [Magnetococcales bacterium]|nr:electron transport complex subunit E [Magnetococcales bacterium]MBF0116856.1 electron transport complex subunit E [Magnetococcales bacterium]
MSDNKTSQLITDGLWYNNGIFVQMLGMCPTLAVTTSAENGLGMGLATTFVLLGANVVVSLIRNFIPSAVRIPGYIIVIAAFVTIVDLSMNAYLHDLHKVLGIFIPLIVVNCIILGRAEAFASKNGVFASAIDGIFTGLGFTLALVVLGSVRELLGSGSLFGQALLGSDFHPSLVFVLPPGAFIALGFILVGVRWINAKRDNEAA